MFNKSWYRAGTTLFCIAVCGVILGCKPDRQPVEESDIKPLAGEPITTASGSAEVNAPSIDDPGSAEAAPPLSDNASEIVVSDPRIKNQPGVGTKANGKLVSNNVGGYLMYGPHIPYPAGKYRVVIMGSIISLPAGDSVVFDAVSNEGKEVHGKQTIAAAPEIDDGTVAELDMVLPANVFDLQIRAYISRGISMEIARVKIQPVR